MFLFWSFLSHFISSCSTFSNGVVIWLFCFWVCRSDLYLILVFYGVVFSAFWIFLFTMRGLLSLCFDFRLVFTYFFVILLFFCNLWVSIINFIFCSCICFFRPDCLHLFVSSVVCAISRGGIFFGDTHFSWSWWLQFRGLSDPDWFFTKIVISQECIYQLPAILP